MAVGGEWWTRWTHWAAWRRRTAGLLLALLTVVFGSACVPPARGASPAGGMLFVVNGLDRTITRVDAGSGRVLETVSSAEEAVRVVAGPEGRALVVSNRGRLSFLNRGPNGGGPTSKAVQLEGDAGAVAIANNERWAVVAHAPAPEVLRGDAQSGAVKAPACRLALIDLRSGEVVRTMALCTDFRDTIHAVAVTGGESGPVAYAAIWRRGWPGSGRIVAVGLEDGVVLASAPVAGVLSQLIVVPPANGAGSRVYGVVSDVGGSYADGNDAIALSAAATEWRLSGWDAATLLPAIDVSLRHQPIQLVAAPGGTHAWAFAGPQSLLEASVLIRVDLASGVSEVVGRTPGRAMALAVFGDRVYVGDPEGDGVWVLDMRGRLQRTIRTGQHPIWLAVS